MSLAVEALGEAALRLELPPSLEPRAVLERLRSLAGVRDVVVAERHAAVTFDPLGPLPKLEGIFDGQWAVGMERAARLHTVSVRYDGPDLERVAAFAKATVEEVVRLHEERVYTVRVVGFLPGFAYLGEVDPRIAAPRLETPRVRVPAGAVGIAGSRTGIYPFVSPGGWNLIGTAIDFAPFDPESGAVIRLGDQVRFVRG